MANTDAVSTPPRLTAFAGDKRIASGTLLEVGLAAKAVLDADPHVPVFIFDEAAKLIHPDLRGTIEEVRVRLEAVVPPAGERDAPAESSDSPAPAAPQGRGRPRLGVVAREVTLLPRHWEWLNAQPGGASVALRKLVEDARKANAGKDRVRRAQEVAYRFMTAMAGDRPGYEESLRALFAGNRARFDELVAQWPADIAEHAKQLAADAFQEQPA